MESDASGQRISLRPITVNNWRQLRGLRVADDQEDFVAPNWQSLLFAAYGFTGDLSHLKVVPLAIYSGDQAVGLVMYNASPERERFFIMRLMVDRRFQGRGYGRVALEQLIERFREHPQAKEVAIGYVPGNCIAGELYSRMGSLEVGLDDEGKEMISVMDLNPQDAPWESLWRKP